MPIRLAIAEDQRIVLELLVARLAREPDIEITGAAGGGREALELAESMRPDVLSLDTGLSGIDGIAVMRALRARQPALRVIALSAHAAPAFVEAMLRAGARGYVLKSATVDELLRAIRAAAVGRPYLSLALRDPQRAQPRPAAGGLGRREIEVLTLLAEGRRSAEIARRLGISAATVDVHRRNIMRKLDLHSVAELTKFALRHGLTSL
jgi:DNA-binding NarL/FixJ family response regulator